MSPPPSVAAIRKKNLHTITRAGKNGDMERAWQM
jgi:hypothetical protein